MYIHNDDSNILLLVCFEFAFSLKNILIYSKNEYIRILVDNIYILFFLIENNPQGALV